MASIHLAWQKDATACSQWFKNFFPTLPARWSYVKSWYCLQIRCRSSEYSRSTKASLKSAYARATLGSKTSALTCVRTTLHGATRSLRISNVLSTFRTSVQLHQTGFLLPLASLRQPAYVWYLQVVGERQRDSPPHARKQYTLIERDATLTATLMAICKYSLVASFCPAKLAGWGAMLENIL